ncbi:hypothetical protein [Geodermatophilus sp. CPCC 205761]|uniref:hypothetical protein n=1 Tax=Geodermatophilus sp. CPCC 205761 TaxID=2936597 RepID=UPI003EEFF5FE
MSEEDAGRMSRYTTAYEAMSAKERRRVTLVEYRCRLRGCLLLAVWTGPEGGLVYQPSSRHSPLRNTGQSAAEARAERGASRFPSSTRSIDDPYRWVAPGEAPMSLVTDGDSTSVSCDHVRRALSRAQVVEDVSTARAGHPTTRRISA